MIIASPESSTRRSLSSRATTSCSTLPIAFTHAGFAIRVRPWRSLATMSTGVLAVMGFRGEGGGVSHVGGRRADHRAGVLAVMAFRRALRSLRAELARSSAAVLLMTL